MKTPGNGIFNIHAIKIKNRWRKPVAGKWNESRFAFLRGLSARKLAKGNDIDFNLIALGDRFGNFLLEHLEIFAVGCGSSFKIHHHGLDLGRIEECGVCNQKFHQEASSWLWNRG